jgi:4-hydroxyacetophenone monooxygenase
MRKIDGAVRHELRAASDEVIEDAVKYADPMVLRGLLYQLTGDPEVATIKMKIEYMGYFETVIPQYEEDVVLLQRKAAAFLKSYRDAGAGSITIGPPERLPESLALIVGEPLPDSEVGLYIEYLALDPKLRSLRWQRAPDPKRLQESTVTIIGAGMAGLIAALELKRAGIPYTVIEKNGGVGGTWYENRYPGARVDVPSRAYTHTVGVDYCYPNPFCAWPENQKYFDWIADEFDLRKDIVFDTEVRALTWDEASASWEIRMNGPGGERVQRSRAVITAVGFLNRPNVPELEGRAEFQGLSWHTARWPQGVDMRGKRVAVIGTGCTGYQMVPELALEAAHVTVFQRTPQWLFPAQGYRSPFPPQVSWLDRNLPFHTNFMRFRTSYAAWYEKMTEVDPNFPDPHSCNASNKGARDACIAFLGSKLSDPELVATMTPPHPIWSARPVIVDPEYGILDAIQRDNVSLVTAGIKRINRTGIEALDGRQHDVDVIVFATGFHASEYLFPMTVTGRGGRTIEAQWGDGGARAYLSCMVPEFPNLWMLYGPNTNGALAPATCHEMVTLYAMQCIERLVLDDKRTIDVKEAAYWRHNRWIDKRNRRKVWSDSRAHTYYWTKYGRSATQNPLTAPELWRLLRQPDFADLEIR